MSTNQAITSVTAKMQITPFPAYNLAVVRWAGPGAEQDFFPYMKELLLRTDEAKCWRWLLDYRAHGDVTEHNAHVFYRVILPNLKSRFGGEVVPRVAVVVTPSATALAAGLPDADSQQKRGYRAQVFTSEGEAMSWLKQ